MDPKFGFAALWHMLSALKTLLDASIAGSDKPVLALFTTDKADFPTGEGQDSWTEWEDYEATYKGYARIELEAGDVPTVTTHEDDDHQHTTIPQKTFAYDSGEAGDSENEIGWVALMDFTDGGPDAPVIIAAQPITPKTMAGDTDVIRVVTDLGLWSLPYPPA